MVFMYKVFNNSLPNNLLAYFKKVYDCHQYNTRKNNVNFVHTIACFYMTVSDNCVE